MKRGAQATLQPQEGLGEPAPLRSSKHSWWRQLCLDYGRYSTRGDGFFRIVFLTQGFWACAGYRVAHSLFESRIPFVAMLVQKAAEILTGISIAPGCEIGEGLYIENFGGIVIAREARIGQNFSVGQQVTIAGAGRREDWGAPVIGDRVYIGAHSVLLGRITVGEDAMICPGSVVTRAVPPRAVVMGNPARVVGWEGSFDWVQYEGMERDPERHASRMTQG